MRGSSIGSRPMTTPITREQELLDELQAPGFRERARERAKRRKSPWNALLIPLFPAGMCASWYGFVWTIVVARNLVRHEHLAGVLELMRSKPQDFLAVVCFGGAIIAAIPFGALACNSLLWCIPPARRVFEKEAEGVAGASFAEATRDMFLFARYVSLPAYLIALAAGVVMPCAGR